MNFRVYLWNLTVPYLYSPPLMQSSNKHNYALIFTYLKYNLCNSKKKKMDTQFAWAHALLFSWSVSSLCWWMSSKTPEKIWEVESLKSLFWHHVYLIGWLVNHISSFKGLFCCLAFRVAVGNMDASYSLDFEHKIYIYIHICIHMYFL